MKPISWKDRLVFRAGALAGALVIKLLNRSCSVRVAGAGNDPLAGARPRLPGEVPIYVAWHQRMFAYFEYLGKRHVAMMISRSRDGELVSRASEHLGFVSIRGSSTRGSVGALRSLLGTLRKRRPVGFLADGPKGPPRVSKIGPLAAARELGDPVIPLAWNADRKWILKSWDRYFLPKPFSRIVLVIGEPVRVRPGAGKDELEEARKRLEQALDRACDVADGWFRKSQSRDRQVAGLAGDPSVAPAQDTAG
jgi:lysophospholipid acyltransferase (LPLAT)-like uncharacterized protein